MTKLVFISSAGGGLGAGPGVTAASGQWSRPGGPHGDISLSWAHCIVNLHPDIIRCRARNKDNRMEHENLTLIFSFNYV